MITMIFNISQDLKQGFLRFRRSMMMAKLDYGKLVATLGAADLMKLKVPKSTQTEVYSFLSDAIAYDKQSQ